MFSYDRIPLHGNQKEYPKKTFQNRKVRSDENWIKTKGATAWSEGKWRLKNCPCFNFPHGRVKLTERKKF